MTSLRPVRSDESLKRQREKQSQESNSGRSSQEIDDVAPLEVVQRAVGGGQGQGQSQGQVLGSPLRLKQSSSPHHNKKCHSRSSSHESYFERRNSEGGVTESVAAAGSKAESALDLSEIQVICAKEIRTSSICLKFRCTLTHGFRYWNGLIFKWSYEYTFNSTLSVTKGMKSQLTKTSLLLQTVLFPILTRVLKQLLLCR